MPWSATAAHLTVKLSLSDAASATPVRSGESNTPVTPDRLPAVTQSVASKPSVQLYAVPSRPLAADEVGQAAAGRASRHAARNSTPQTNRARCGRRSGAHATGRARTGTCIPAAAAALRPAVRVLPPRTVPVPIKPKSEPVCPVCRRCALKVRGNRYS